MMRVSITVDPELIEEIRRLTKVRTKREAIERAFQELIRHHRLRERLAQAGSGVVEMDLERSCDAGARPVSSSHGWPAESYATRPHGSDICGCTGGTTSRWRCSHHPRPDLVIA